MTDAIAFQGTKLRISDGSEPAVLTQVKGLTGFSGFDGQASEIDATTSDSTAKEFLMGLQDFGNCSFDINYLPEDPGQVACRAAKSTRVLKEFELEFPDGTKLQFSAYVTSMPLSGSVDDKISRTISLRISGDVIEE